jgi:hypothetical protein
MSGRLSLFAAGLALALGLAACGGSSGSRVTTTPTDPAPAASNCPMDVSGTSVTVEETPTGGALVFVTTGDVAALRQHVGVWAEKHNAHHGAMGPLPTGEEQAAGGHDHHAHHGGQEGEAASGGGGEHAGHGGGGGDWQTMIGVHSRAVSSDIDGGVRLELVTFPDQVGALRDELRGHVAHMSSSGCAMGH